MSSSPKLLVLGATGQTGQHLVEQALERNHHVTALVRDPNKFTIKHDNLQVVKCDIFNKEELLPQVKNADVIMSTLGFSLFQRTVQLGYLNIAKLLSECMKETGKKRVIFMHSWYTEPESRNKSDSFLMRNVFLVYVLGVLLDGMHEAEGYLGTQEHLDYTVILPPQLGNGLVTDKNFNTTDSEWFVPNGTMYIERADVARYMLDVVEDETSYKKLRAISVKSVEEPASRGCTVS